MPVLIKTGPLSVDHGRGTVLRFKEKAYRDPVFGKGEQAFIWIDGDGQGGKNSRLYAEGMVTEEPYLQDPNSHQGLVNVKVVLTSIEPEDPLRYAEDIRPHRDDSTDPTLHSLAAVICKNAHRKVTLIGKAEAAYLKSRFDDRGGVGVE